MRRTSQTRAALAALAVLVASPIVSRPAAAQLTAGSTLTFSGAANATELGSPGVFLEFLGDVALDGSGLTGDFASLAHAGQPTTATIANLTVGVGPQQIREVLRIGPYAFDLARLPSGAYAQDQCYVLPAAGQRCTPYQLPGYDLSPFYLENLATPGTDGILTALVSFDVAGTVTAHGVTQAFFGTISTTFVGASYQEALAGLEAAGLQGVPFKGRFVVQSAAAVVTPEPGTVLLVATGLAGVAGVTARRRRRPQD
jgi:hypothetical protein